MKNDHFAESTGNGEQAGVQCIAGAGFDEEVPTGAALSLVPLLRLVEVLMIARKPITSTAAIPRIQPIGLEVLTGADA